MVTSASAAHALMYAAAHGNVQRVNELLDAGVSASCRWGIGLHTPLKHAAVNEHVHIMHRLLSAGADIDSCGDDNKTALYFAVITFKPKAVRFLLTRGATMSVTTTDGTTPLMAALSMFLPCNVMDKRKLRVISMLLSAGATVFGHNVDRLSALVQVVRAPDFSIPPPLQLRAFDMLVKHGADVDEQDSHGRTALHYAAAVNNVAMAMRLLHVGANIATVDLHERTAEDLAARNGYTRFTELLAEVHGRVRDKPRLHAFSMGLHQRSTSVVQLLSMEYIYKIFGVRKAETPHQRFIEEIVVVQGRLHGTV